MRDFLRNVLVALGVVAAFVIGAAAPAFGSAQTTASSVPSVNLFCGTGNSSLLYEQQSASNLLPVDRWASATGSLHTDFGGGFFGLGLNDLAQRIQRNGIETGALAAGNALWKAGTDMTAAATNFCFGHDLGATADHYASLLGNAFVSSGIVAALVALAIVAFFWRLMRRSDRPWHSLGRALLVTAIFAAMIAGASASTSTSFGAFSPGWVITSVYNAMSGIASLPTMAVAEAADASIYNPTGTSNNELSCANYTGQLLRNYQADYGSSPAAQAAGSVPMALDAMWEQTGLRAYMDIQYGQQVPESEISDAELANYYGLRVYCRQLESAAGIPASSQSAITQAGAKAVPGAQLPTPSPQSAAWLSPADSNNIIDASVIAWAACEYTGSGWSVDPEFQDLPNHKVTVTDCQDWWGTSADNWSPGPFHWSTSTSAIGNDTPNSPQVADFLLNWHGDDNGQAMVTAITFLPASVAVFAVFLLLSGAVLIAKMALLVLIILAPIVLVLSLVPGRRWEGSAAKLGKYGLGLIVFGVMAQLILSLIAVIAGFLTQAGASLFGPGSVMAIVWAAFTPFAAVWIMHHLFKALGAPSPFKLHGALGWAAAAGGVGIGIGEALHRRTAGRAAQSLRLAGRTAARSALSSGARFVGRPSTRTGGLTPGLQAGEEAISAGTVAGALAGGAAAGGAGASAVPGSSWQGVGAMAGGVAQDAETTPGVPAGQGAPDKPPRPTSVPDVVFAEKAQVQAERAERKAAARHYVSTLIGPKPEGAGLGTRAAYAAKARLAVPIAAANERLREHGLRFQQAPVRSGLRAAAKLGLIGAAVMVTPASGVATAGVVAGVMAARHARRAHLEHPGRKAFIQSQRLEAWRAYQARQTTRFSGEGGREETGPGTEQAPPGGQERDVDLGAAEAPSSTVPGTDGAPGADDAHVAAGAPGDSPPIHGGGSGSHLAGYGAPSRTWPTGSSRQAQTIAGEDVVAEPDENWQRRPAPVAGARERPPFSSTSAPVETGVATMARPAAGRGAAEATVPRPDENWQRRPAPVAEARDRAAMVPAGQAQEPFAPAGGTDAPGRSPAPVEPAPSSPAVVAGVAADEAAPTRATRDSPERAAEPREVAPAPSPPPTAGPVRVARPVAVGAAARQGTPVSEAGLRSRAPASSWDRVRATAASAAARAREAPVRQSLKTATKVGLVAGAATVASPAAGAAVIGAAAGIAAARLTSRRVSPEQLKDIDQSRVNAWRGAQARGWQRRVPTSVSAQHRPEAPSS